MNNVPCCAPLMRACGHPSPDLPRMSNRVLRRRPYGQNATASNPGLTEQTTPRVAVRMDILPPVGFGEADGRLNVLVRMNRPRHPRLLALTTGFPAPLFR